MNSWSCSSYTESISMNGWDFGRKQALVNDDIPSNHNLFTLLALPVYMQLTGHSFLTNSERERERERSRIPFVTSGIPYDSH